MVEKAVPTHTISVTGNAKIFVETLQQTSFHVFLFMHVSLARAGSLGHPYLLIVGDDKEEVCWQRLLSQFSNKLWGMDLKLSDSKQNNSDK